MSELNLPNLNLFNKTSFKYKRQFTSTPRDQSPFFDAIKETNRIDNQIYATYLPYRPVLYEPQFLPPPYHLYHPPIPINPIYIDPQETLRRQQLDSFNTTQRSRSYIQQEASYRRRLESSPLQSKVLASKDRQIIKTPYVNHQYVPTASYKKETKQNSSLPKKDVYLNRQDQNRKKEDPQKSIIQNIPNSMVQTEKNNIPHANPNLNINANLSKIINDSNYMNTNQSLIIDVPKIEPKKQTVSEQVQTDQINRSSFFVETRKVKKMDEASFKKTIKDLNVQISNLNLQMESEDIIIDLSDLVLTKDQYFEESKTILRDLQILADQRTSSGILIKSKKQTQMIWPQF